MKTTNSMRVRASRLLSDRYAYRAQPNYVCELVAFAIIVVTAIWPVFLLAISLNQDLNPREGASPDSFSTAFRPAVAELTNRGDGKGN
jgi:hypothetical protein